VVVVYVVSSSILNALDANVCRTYLVCMHVSP
jgi:hypothetical protein